VREWVGRSDDAGIKKRPKGAGELVRVGSGHQAGLKRMKQEVGEKPIELNHDSSGEGEPDRGKDWSSSEKLFHGFYWMGWQGRMAHLPLSDFVGGEGLGKR
jgi:hypothetical protein